MDIQAVITADIVNSTKLSQVAEKKLLKQLNEVLVSFKFEFYRGDSFQVYQTDASKALKTGLLCRAAAIAFSKEDENNFDIRFGIGIGTTQTPVKTLSTAKGEAFVLSGRALDSISKVVARVSIVCTNNLANEGLQVISEYTDSVFQSMTAKQAAVIFEMLKGQTQQMVAKKLKKSKSTINQHVSAGRWDEIERLLIHYDNIIKNIP